MSPMLIRIIALGLAATGLGAAIYADKKGSKKKDVIEHSNVPPIPQPKPIPPAPEPEPELEPKKKTIFKEGEAE